MMGNYAIEVAIFRPVDDDASRQVPIHPGIHTYRTAEDDLRNSMLPDRIPREGGPAITWTEYMELKMASEAETRVGCVVRHPRRGTVVRGQNSLPRGVKAFPPERLFRPEKYAWIEHAERNALYQAARNGIPFRGCTMYVELMPCVDCARGIIQAGIEQVGSA
jgi:tRNA(Arg) A34 adenosine deaminase TadA